MFFYRFTSQQYTVEDVNTTIPFHCKLQELYTLHFSRNRAPKEDNLLPKKPPLQPESKQDDEGLLYDIEL